MQLCENLKCEPPRGTNMVKSLDQNYLTDLEKSEQM